MENTSKDPRNKDQKIVNRSSDTPNFEKTKTDSDSDQRHRARNYKNGEDDIEGPDFNKNSEGADGDTTVNAGIFK